MSKAPKNIEKILLGVSVLAAGGFAALGFMKAGAVEEDFSHSPKTSGSNETDVPGAMKVVEASTSLTTNRTFEMATVPSTRIGERPVDLFVGVPLFASRDNPNDPVDLLTSDDVHPPIPNEWWLKYDVSPSYADSSLRDDDEDGFGNLEEFEAKTDPGDEKSHPPLVAKLSYVKDESVEWLLEYGMAAQGKWLPKYKDSTGAKTKVGFADGLEPGATFFADDPVNGRFKFIKFEERTVHNERVNTDENLTFAIFEDQRPNKKGELYEIPSRVPKKELASYLHYDRTAVLDLQALGLAGNEFKVEEKTAFALPPTAEDKKYFLAEVTPDSITVTWKENEEEKSVTIPKGGLPEMDLNR